MEYGDIPAWIALALSIVSIGTQYASRNERLLRERLDEKLRRLDRIGFLLVQIRTSAIAYWLHPEATAAKDGLMLTHYLKELSGEVSRNSALLWPEAWREVLDMKMQMTGSDFQRTNRPSRPANDPLIIAFSDSCSVLTEKLNRAIHQSKSLN